MGRMRVCLALCAVLAGANQAWGQGTSNIQFTGDYPKKTLDAGVIAIAAKVTLSDATYTIPSGQVTVRIWQDGKQLYEIGYNVKQDPIDKKVYDLPVVYPTMAAMTTYNVIVEVVTQDNAKKNYKLWTKPGKVTTN